MSSKTRRNRTGKERYEFRFARDEEGTKLYKEQCANVRIRVLQAGDALPDAGESINEIASILLTSGRTPKPLAVTALLALRDLALNDTRELRVIRGVWQPSKSVKEFQTQVKAKLLRTAQFNEEGPGWVTAWILARPAVPLWDLMPRSPVMLETLQMAGRVAEMTQAEAALASFRRLGLDFEEAGRTWGWTDTPHRRGGRATREIAIFRLDERGKPARGAREVRYTLRWSSRQDCEVC